MSRKKIQYIIFVAQTVLWDLWGYFDGPGTERKVSFGFQPYAILYKFKTFQQNIKSSLLTFKSLIWKILGLKSWSRWQNHGTVKYVRTYIYWAYFWILNENFGLDYFAYFKFIFEKYPRTQRHLPIPKLTSYLDLYFIFIRFYHIHRYTEKFFPYYTTKKVKTRVPTAQSSLQSVGFGNIWNSTFFLKGKWSPMCGWALQYQEAEYFNIAFQHFQHPKLGDITL